MKTDEKMQIKLEKLIIDLILIIFDSSKKYLLLFSILK